MLSPWGYMLRAVTGFDQSSDFAKSNTFIDWGNNSTQQEGWVSLLHCDNALGPKANRPNHSILTTDHQSHDCKSYRDQRGSAR